MKIELKLTLELSENVKPTQGEVCEIMENVGVALQRQIQNSGISPEDAEWFVSLASVTDGTHTVSYKTMGDELKVE
jgi:hypothetical protein